MFNTNTLQTNNSIAYSFKVSYNPNDYLYLLLEEYLPILIFLIFALVLSCIILLLSYIVSEKNDYVEKLSAYECGFDPFQDARVVFYIKFYLVAILFLVFDLEVSFLFPWAVVLSKISFEGFIIMFLFLLILVEGFFYEWICGGLDYI